MEIESTKDAFFDSERERTAVSGEKCPGCGDNLEFDPETGKLKCPSCGTEKEILTRAGEEIAFSSLIGQNGNWQNETHIYHCSNCNAEEVLDRREIAHICPFCGSPSVVEREEIDTLRPNALLPFKIDKDDATKIVSVWAKKKWFAPKDFKTYFRPETINGVYLPAFTFDADTYSSYSGRLGEYYYVTVRRNGKSVREQRTRYFSVSGNYREFFDDIAVNATDAVPPRVMSKLMHYDYHGCVAYQEDFLYGFSALLYSRNGEICWKDAQRIAENNVRSGILSQYSHDTVQYLDVRTSYANVTYKYMLLPMYIGNYSYKNKPYSFYINGRSGKMTGKSPVSPFRVSLAVAIGAVLIAAVGLLVHFLG